MTGGATIAVGVHYSAAESRPHGRFLGRRVLLVSRHT